MTTATKAPSSYSFGKVIANEAEKISLEEVKSSVVTAVKEGATTIVKTAAFGAGAYIAVIGIAALAAFLYRMKMQSAILKSLSK